MGGTRRWGSVGDPWTVLFGPWSVGVGLAVVAATAAGAVWIGPSSLGVDLCWFRRLSGGLPCPGCGLTRSLEALARGDVAASLALHPFGAVVLLWALCAASSPLWPHGWRRRVRAAMERRRGGFDRVYRGAIFAFIGFGVARLVWALLPAGS